MSNDHHGRTAQLARSLTLDPSGMHLAQRGFNFQAVKPCCLSAPEPHFASGPAAGDHHQHQHHSRDAASAPSPSPFCAAGKAVVSAFREQEQLQELQPPAHHPCSPGSAFRNQKVIECSSSEVEAPLPPQAVVSLSPNLSSAISSPSPPGGLPPATTAPVAPLPHSASAAPAAPLGPLGSCPAHGVKAVCGKRNKMEDMYAVQPNFFDIPLSPTSDEVQNKLPQRIAVQLEPDGSPSSSSLLVSPNCGGDAGGHCAEPDPSANSYSCGSDTSMGLDTLHFFGVYDGHGGCQAAEHCARRLHHHLSQALASACGVRIADGNQLLQRADGDDSQADCSITSTLMQSVANFACLTLGSGNEACSPQQQQQCSSPTLPQRPSLAKGSVDSASTASSSGQEQHLLPLPESDLGCDNDSSGTGSDRSDCVGNVSDLLEEALKSAFVRTDEEFAEDFCAAMVGSTALVALVGTRKIWLANCGDSRAVMCRGNKAIQLTDDHKPEREDEAERVEKAGGQVLFWNGHRVMGVLAMSRAIGDHGLRPYIIPEPEVSVMCRSEEDDFLLLASDGLWDVMLNQDAVDLTVRCIKRAKEKGASRSAAVRIAASVLTKAAIDRGSKDNVTVVIVDLKSSTVDPSGAAATTCSGTAKRATNRSSSSRSAACAEECAGAASGKVA